jgi:hypothetical protein
MAVVAAAAKLRAAGFEPGPQVIARTFARLTQPDDFLASLAGAAGVSPALPRRQLDRGIAAPLQRVIVTASGLRAGSAWRQCGCATPGLP